MRDLSLVQDTIESALRGVGDLSRTVTESGDVALHVRRPLSIDEWRNLPRRADAPIFPIELVWSDV